LKNSHIAKAISVIMGCSILAIFLVPTGFAYRAVMDDDQVTSEASCNDKPSTFTLFPYARLRTNSNGSTAGVEVHLSSAGGDCSTIIYSSHEIGYSTALNDTPDNYDSAIVLR